ncbi:MAG: glycoside hydrolase N-terminal domain-containing protein, partial [Candidatus Latescibacteria bacterium]|nr:glycoside hydrolase N-terminal domain-containing protein [Candidatus Latescibacterota bacterium]
MLAEKGKPGMIMRGPATRWQDASPTGNGAIGAMMYGQIRSDVILLNHEALYYPRGRGKLVDVSDQLPEVRRLIEQGQYEQANSLMPRVHAERGGAAEGSTSDFTDPYQPFCDIRLRTSTEGPFRHYRRGVDFETGRVWMTWEDDAGSMARELFVSRASDTVLLRIRGERSGGVGCRLSLSRDDAELRRDGGWASQKNLPPTLCEQRIEGGGWLIFTGRFAESYAFGAVGRVTAVNGRMRAERDEIVVEGADELLLQVKLFVHEDPEEAVPGLRGELQDEAADFDQALAEHAVLHGDLFNRMCLELAPEKPQSNEEMLMAAYEGTAPNALIQTMFEFGRYLLICSNRPGGWPANLQGIWNGDYAPAWNSDFHNDENVQMNYWQALPGNLPEATLPFFDYFERFMDDFRENARKLYGCRGILAPIAQTTHGQAFPCVWTNWISAAGWLAQLFYDYTLFTGDREFLAERAVPWLREVAHFYEDFLFEGPDGKLVFSPSLSPENTPIGEGMHLLTVNATMDVAICREVLNNLCEACESLGIEQDGVARWRVMLDRLPEYAVNRDGALREWLHPKFEDNYHHRHQSHLYPLFPGFEITEETHPELVEACRVAVEKRLVIGLTSQTGWSMAHMANIYARLGQGDRALECIEILCRSSTGPNLFTYHNDWRDMGLSLGGWGEHPPFQIDANFGITAAILEMLVFSKPGLVKLLPAIPDKWTQGRACGIACRGGIVLDLQWDRSGGAMRATLTSKRDQKVWVK